MINTAKALGLALVMGTAVAAVPAAAQQPAPAQAPAQGSVQVSKGASKAVGELQAAVNANDFAGIPAKAAAANAVAKTPQDRFAIAQLQLKAAVAEKNNAKIAAALDAMVASGGAPASVLPNIRINQAKLKYQAKDYAGTSAALESLLAANPNDVDALVLLAETRNAQGRSEDAIAAVQKAIAAKRAAGQPIPQEWYKRAVQIAYNKKLPVTDQIAIDWARAYPSPVTWRDTIRVVRDVHNVSGTDEVDYLRLQRATGSLQGDSDYFRYANGLALKGLPGEAKAVLDEGYAAGAISKTKPMFGQLSGLVNGRVAADRASLPSIEKSALAGNDGKKALVTGDVLLGYGEYSRAAALYRAALSKPGADQELAKLRLGIALARSGDKAGAATALKAVTGARAPIARLWLAYIGQA